MLGSLLGVSDLAWFSLVSIWHPSFRSTLSKCSGLLGFSSKVLIHFSFCFVWFTLIRPITDCYRARGQWWWVTHALCISISTPFWGCPGPSFVLCTPWQEPSTMAASRAHAATLQSYLTALERWVASDIFIIYKILNPKSLTLNVCSPLTQQCRQEKTHDDH